jgi:hypothetical protein
MLHDPSYPQPSLAGGDYKPSNVGAAPIVNSVDTQGRQAVNQALSVYDDTPKSNWLAMARDAYNSSDNWLQANQRATWARNFAHYRSEHGPDSPIHLQQNQHRPKYFYPKTRTLVRAIQASGAAAFFSSADVVAIESEDADNQEQSDAAKLMKELVNYRLTSTVPWYQIVLGGLQETAVTGIVVSHQSWVYEEEERIIRQENDPETGETTVYFSKIPTQDKLQVRLVPAENIRISPSSDWADPANSSPYFIELIPMFLGDVQTRIKKGGDPKSGEPAWRDIGESILLGAGNRAGLDQTRRARAGSTKLDPKTNDIETAQDFRVVWIHRNIIRHNGIDWLFYTVGTHVLLSDPVPLAEVIPWAQGKRDYVIGKMEVETDTAYPESPVGLMAPLQRSLNELKNARFENVRQVLNRRYLYRAGNQVDVRALSRNVPGGLIGVNAPGDLSTHVKALEAQDVTSSSYQEEDRLNLTMDDLTGSTFGNTVNSNRRLQETATGMNLMADNANLVREMEIRTFVETWMEPVIRQIVQLEAMYETDETALIVASRKAKLKRVLLEYFDYRFAVSVNAGLGSTSATQRMERFQNAIVTATTLVPEAALALKGEEITKEIFGIAGFDNGARFFDFEKAKQLQAQQAQQGDPSIELGKEQLQVQLQIAEQKAELDRGKLMLAYREMELKLKKMEAEIGLQDAKKVNEKTTAVYEAVQTAGAVAQNPDLAESTDIILKSSGFVDEDAGPIIETPAAAAPVNLPEPRPNTSPSQPPLPQSGRVGERQGIETQVIE